MNTNLNQNLIKEEIAQLNHELCHLRQHFTNFKETYGNIVDKWLVNNLTDTLFTINNILTNFNVIDVGDTSLKIDLSQFKANSNYFCNVCRRDISNRILSLQSHIHSKEHKGNETKNKNKFETVVKVANNLRESNLSLNVGGLQGPSNNVKITNSGIKTEKENLNSVTKELLQSNLERTIKQLLIEVSHINISDSLAIKNSLKEALSPHFKYVNVYSFGSRENGTGTVSTDLDVYVDIDHSYHGVDIEKKHIILERLEKVVEILNTKSHEWVNIRKVKARIPIIKVFNKMEGIDCDISFSSGLGCCNTELIKYLINLQPMFRKMIVFLKKWLKRTALNVYINNYTLNLLIVFYLQQKALLPPIHKLQNNIEPLEIEAWNGGFQQKTASELKLNRTENAVRHITGFFNYYSSHDLFYNNTLCLYLGRLVPNTHIKDLSNESLKRYNDFANKYKDQPDLLFRFEFMNIQDPFDLANNTAKMVPLSICRKFVNLAKLSFEILQK